MVINQSMLLGLLAIGLCLFLIGAYIKASEDSRKKRREERRKQQEQMLLNDSDNYIDTDVKVINSLNTNPLIKNFGARFDNSKTDILFRKSKNPWGLTPEVYNVIRIGGLVIGALLAICAYFMVGISIAIVFCVLGLTVFFVPKMKYEGVAKKRESQWNQLYQFMWVIKHNLGFYDPKKTWIEVERYVKEHTNNLPELEEGFHDFAEHWNSEYMDDYIMRTYGDFTIPKQLFDIILISEQTGEFPENELNSLRTIIINKMDFHVQEVLSTVGMKATLYSTPFVLASVSIVVLIPVILSVAQAFS